MACETSCTSRDRHTRSKVRDMPLGIACGLGLVLPRKPGREGGGPLARQRRRSKKFVVVRMGKEASRESEGLNRVPVSHSHAEVGIRSGFWLECHDSFRVIGASVNDSSMQTRWKSQYLKMPSQWIRVRVAGSLILPRQIRRGLRADERSTIDCFPGYWCFPPRPFASRSLARV